VRPLNHEEEQWPQEGGLLEFDRSRVLVLLDVSSHSLRADAERETRSSLFPVRSPKKASLQPRYRATRARWALHISPASSVKIAAPVAHEVIALL
jgi:hypothetical protein